MSASPQTTPRLPSGEAIKLREVAWRIPSERWEATVGLYHSVGATSEEAVGRLTAYVAAVRRTFDTETRDARS